MSPHVRACLDCGQLISASLSRCADCQARDNIRHNRPRANYRTPAWRRTAARITANGCAICGRVKRVAAHHIKPRKDGGSDDPSNLLPLCTEHHSELEADIRAGRDTELRRLVELITN